MTVAWVIVGFLVIWGSVLAMAEASISRMSRVRAMSLREEGRKNADTLEKIEEEPTAYLNAIYFSVMLAQNGSAILVAVAAEAVWGRTWIGLASFVFTLIYFILVEAMSKTFAILHTDQVSLALARIVRFNAKVLSLPTKGLIKIANVLLPGKGLQAGPFFTEEHILSMATVGHEEGAIDMDEKDLIHSIFEFGDTVVREVMVPRPDMIVVDGSKPVRRAMDLAIRHGYSRIPVFGRDADDITGIVYVKDLFKALRRNGDENVPVSEMARTAMFVPEAKSVAELLKEFQRDRRHMAIVVDEFGDVAGLVTLEDVLEEIVGEITDEYDVDDPALTPLEDGRWRVKAKMTISEFNELMDADLSDEEDWTSVGGLIAGVLGKVPAQGDEITHAGFKFRAERVSGRRIGTVLVSLLEPAESSTDEE